MKILLSMWLSCLLTANVLAPAWSVETSAVSFSIRNWGLPLSGSFGDLKSTIRFDPVELAGSIMVASVGVATIKTGMVPRDSHLQTRPYFDAERYPRLTMMSKRLRKLDATHFVGLFDVTIRDVTKALEIPFTYVRQGNQATFDGQSSVNRVAFGVGDESLVLDDKVLVRLTLSATTTY